MMQLLTAFLLGLLTILDPCTLFTSITAISYIDREISNKRRVLLNGLMFVLGKLVTYMLLSVPFLLGAQTDGFQHALEHYGEPILAVFMVICGVVLLFTGHHHHEHDHGVNKMLSQLDSRFTGMWSFMLGIFFAIAFCPHRLVYFVTMIDMAVTLPITWSWLMPFVFALGTGLPVIVIAWIICYSAVSIGNLTNRLSTFEKWFRYICAALFIGLGIYMGIHAFSAHDHHEHTNNSSQPPITYTLNPKLLTLNAQL